MKLGQVKTALVLLPLSWLLAGCAMYSETRDKQGKALQEAYAKVDLKAQFEVPRSNRANILAQQLATIDSLEAIRREGMIRAVAASRKPSDTVLAQLNVMSALSGADKILGAGIAGSTPEQQTASRRARSAALQAWTDDAASAAQIRQFIASKIEPEFIRQGLEQPTCDDIRTQSKAKAAIDKWIAERSGTHPGQAVAGSMQYLTMKCKALQAALNHQADTQIGGELAKALAVLAKEEADYKVLKERTEAGRTALKAALAKREEAAAKNDSKGVRGAAEDVKALLAAISVADDVFSIQFMSDTEQDSLDAFLTAVTDTKVGETPAAGSSKAAMAVVLFPDLMKSAKSQFDSADKVSLAPLVMQKKLSQIAYDAATRDIKTRELRIDLLQQKVELLSRQVIQFTEMDALVADMHPSLLRLPMTEVLAAHDRAAAPQKGHYVPGIDDKAKVWTALATYIDTGTRIDGEVAKLGMKLTALESEILLGYSEANVTQWDTLISANVSQLGAYGAAGIKVDQITALINSATLLWIGAGVH